MHGWKWIHLDQVVAFAQAHAEIEVSSKPPTGFHVEDIDDNDASERCCLKLLKLLRKKRRSS